MAGMEQSMAMSQEVDFRCLQCDKPFELTHDQVDELMACGGVECPHCVQSLALPAGELARLVSVKDKNRRKILVFGSMAVGMPVTNIIVTLQWGSGLGFLSFFIGLFIFYSSLPSLKETSFIRIDLTLKAEIN